MEKYFPTTIFEFIFKWHFILFDALLNYFWSINNPRFYIDYNPVFFEVFIYYFVCFLLSFIIFWILWVVIWKKSFNITKNNKIKYLFLYFFPWIFLWFIWAPIIFWLLHWKIDKIFFINCMLSIIAYSLFCYTYIIFN